MFETSIIRNNVLELMFTISTYMYIINPSQHIHINFIIHRHKRNIAYNYSYLQRAIDQTVDTGYFTGE